MSLLPLLIGPVERKMLRQVVENATQNPIPFEVLQKLIDGELLPADVNEGKTCDLPTGFHVVYTHEQQEHGILRHMSVSIDLPGRVPHPEAVRMIMEEMGFINDLADCIWWLEPCGDAVMHPSLGRTQKEAINVVEPLDGNWEPFKLSEMGQ